MRPTRNWSIRDGCFNPTTFRSLNSARLSRKRSQAIWRSRAVPTISRSSALPASVSDLLRFTSTCFKLEDLTYLRRLSSRNRVAYRTRIVQAISEFEFLKPRWLTRRSRSILTNPFTETTSHPFRLRASLSVLLGLVSTYLDDDDTRPRMMRVDQVLRTAQFPRPATTSDSALVGPPIP